MDKRIIVIYSGMNGMLDFKYTLYEDGSVVHFYDANIYPGNRDITRVLQAKNLKSNIKEALLENTKDENKELAKTLLGL